MISKLTKLLIPLAFVGCTELPIQSMYMEQSPGSYNADVVQVERTAGGTSVIDDEIRYFYLPTVRVIIPEEVIDQEAECSGDMLQEMECETDNPCKGYMVRECEDEKWGQWSKCYSFRQLTEGGSYRNPKVADGKVAYIGINGNFNKDIYVDDLVTGDSEQLVQQAAIVNISDDYLRLVHAGQVGDCSIVDLASYETVYDDLCASDIEGSTLVVSENKNDIIAMDFLTGETSEVAVNKCHYHPKMSGRNVVFTSSDCYGDKRAHIWNLDTFDDQALGGEGNDKNILIEGNTVLWSNYLDGKVRLMKYDIQNDTVSELFSKDLDSEGCDDFTKYNGFMNLADFNGRSLVYKTYTLFNCEHQGNNCSCSQRWDLRLYDIFAGKEEVITTDVISGFKHKPLSRPSLDQRDLVFGQFEDIFHCELKDAYLHLPDLKIGGIEALPNVFSVGEYVYVQFQIVNVSDVVVDKPFSVSVTACTPDAITCNQPTSIEIAGIGLEAVVAGVQITPGVDQGYIKVTVDSLGEVKERFEDNNEHGCEFMFESDYD